MFNLQLLNHLTNSITGFVLHIKNCGIVKTSVRQKVLTNAYFKVGIAYFVQASDFQLATIF